MSNTRTQNIENATAFIVAVSSNGRSKLLRCFFFTLTHSTDHGPAPYTSDALAETAKLCEALPDEERNARAVAMATAFVESAEKLASVERRPQLFSIAGYTSVGGSSAAVANHPFRVDPDLSSLSEYTEEPDGKGALSQVMRGFEAVNKELNRRIDVYDRSIHQAMDRMERFCDTMAKRNEFLETSALNMVKTYQDAMDNQVARTTDANIRIMQANRTERHWMLAEHELPKLLAILADRVAGAGPIGAMVKGLSPDMLRTFNQAIQAMGTKEQKAQWAQALDTYFPQLGLLKSPEAASIPYLDPDQANGVATQKKDN